ncbi:hypothetical protein C9439_01910 [archaeon SCG-AAA382B04]|nr:hypothetical protein C9439_01910 [archaeon SCG-AAA382B04]
MNWLSNQLVKIANNLGKKVTLAKEEFKEGYKKSLKEADWDEIDTEEETQPFIDIFKKEEKIKIIAEIPGTNQEDIEVGVIDPKMVHIHAPSSRKKYSTTIELPAKIKNKNASYNYKNGVLTINLELA